MPSNAMKISHLIEQLTLLRAQHGDLDCVLPIARDGVIIALDGRNISVQGEALGQKLPAPCVVFGAWVDQEGRVRTTPGQRYEATADDGAWNYDRSAAPQDVIVDVWKRYGGQDRGFRQDERWYVYEGKAKPLEIIPAGILGWKPCD